MLCSTIETLFPPNTIGFLECRTEFLFRYAVFESIESAKICINHSYEQLNTIKKLNIETINDVDEVTENIRKAQKSFVALLNEQALLLKLLVKYTDTRTMFLKKWKKAQKSGISRLNQTQSKGTKKKKTTKQKKKAQKQPKTNPSGRSKQPSLVNSK